MSSRALGPNGLLNKSFTAFVVSAACAFTATFLVKQYLPELYESKKSFFQALVTTIPILVLLMDLAVRIWVYLFRLANFVQVTRDYSVSNIEHLRLRIAELTPPGNKDETESDAPAPDANVPRPNDQIERPLSTKERNTLLRLVAGMAIDSYGFDPKAARSSTARQIAEDLARHGINIDEDTVRNYLKEAKATILPANPRQS
ncbi:hypothetical protein WG899_09455 [Paucibacter sp. AS339]|uniref:hypothetical protein n=1 Tax=Paucibacter hankyongi TaxID=3133434 RepID=UPI0030AE0D5D